MAVKIAPDARRQFLNASGVPYSGAKLFYYASGSSTKQNTYTTSVGNVANSNPIVLDSAGRTPYGVWLTAGLTYKEVLAPSTDTDPPGSPIYTEDGISGINDTAGTTSQWVASSLTPTYISGTSFSVAGDQTTELHIGRRLQLSVTAGTVYARISNSVYGALTTVTVVMDSGSLDSGLSSFNWSALTAVNHALPNLSTALLAGVGIAGVSSPTFTGTPAAPTAAADTNTTQVATTAFVLGQKGTSTPLIAGTAAVGVGNKYAREDHVHPRTDLSAPSVVNTTSGSTVVISSSVPSWARRITLVFYGVSTNGTQGMTVQIGDSGGLGTTGYSSEGSTLTAAAVASSTTTVGFLIRTNTATAVCTGTMMLHRVDSTLHKWVGTLTMRSEPSTVVIGSGSKELSTALTSVNVTSGDTFDSGAVAIFWE